MCRKVRNVQWAQSSKRTILKGATSRPLKTIGKSLLAGGARLSQNIANIPRMIAKGGAKLLDFLTPDKIYKEEEDPYVKFFDKVVGGYEEVTQKHIEDLGELKGVRKDLPVCNA